MVKRPRLTDSKPTFDVHMPRLGESIVEAVLLRWLVGVEARVRKGQVIAEVETDKATTEIPSPCDGTVARLWVDAGQTVPIHDPILSIRLDHDTKADPPPPGPLPASRPLSSPPRVPRPNQGPARYSPAVRRLARRFQLDLTTMEGSGHNGRVTREDVYRVLDEQRRPTIPPTASNESRPPPRSALERPSLAPVVETEPPWESYVPHEGDQVVAFSPRRAQIASHISTSLRTAAHVAAIAELDMSRILAARVRDQARAQASGIKLSILPYLVQAVAQALTEHPELNGSVLDRSLVLRRARNIGVAVDTPEGVVVPVIQGADELSLLGIARRLQELAEKARARRLSKEDVQSGSFTISNPGRDGNLVGISVIRQPEVAILRLGSITKRPVVRPIEGEDAIVIRPIMYAALSYDHRVIDGRKGNAFLKRLTELANTWA